MKKRVLFLIESLAGGGAEKVLSVLIKFFDYGKYEVTVCPLVDVGVYRDEVKKYATYYSPVINYNGNSLSRLWNRLKYKLVYSLLPLSWVYRWFIPKDNDVEIAFCEGFTTKLLAHSGSKARKIAWIHTDLTDNPWPIKLKIFRNVGEERRAYRAFDKIVCVSHTVEDSFQKRYSLPGRTCTIYNPIDVDYIRACAGSVENQSDNICRIISIGRLVPQKGYDRLLKVAKQLHDEQFRFSLQILGEGEERPALEKLIEENDMGDFVSLPGFCRNPYEQLTKADFFVCSSRAEGFSLVIAEALVLGVPVISTYCSGPNELLKDGQYGLLVDNTDEALYRGLKSVLSNSTMPPRPDVEEFANRFRAERIMEQVYSIL